MAKKPTYEELEQRVKDLDKKLEEASKKKNERFDLAVKGTDDGIWDWDIATGEVYHSPRFKESLGYQDHEIDSSYNFWDSRLHPDDQERVLEEMRKHLEERVRFDSEYMLRTKSGEYRWFSSRGQALWDENGQATRMAGSLRDITERKQAEETLKKSHEELERRVEERTADLFKTNEQLMNEIKEHNQAEKAQQESEEHYRILVETASRSGQAFVLLQDTDQVEACFVFGNDATSDITGYSLGELAQMSWLDIVHPLYRDSVKDRYRRRLRRETIGNIFEITIVSKRGTEVPIELTSVATEFQGKKSLAVFFRDIGDRKRAEETLRKSEDRFHHAFENANIGVCLVSTDGHLIKVNGRLCEILGYSREKLEGMPVNDITHLEDLELSFDFFQQSISGETDNKVYEKRYVHSEGYYGWIQISSSIVRGLEGEPLYFISHVQDITDRKRAEEALKESEARYKSLVELSPEAVFVHQEGIIVYLNPAGLRILGATDHEEFIGKPVLDFIHPDSHEIAKRRIREMRERKTTLSPVELKYIRSDKKIIDVMTTGTYVEYLGKPSILSVSRDITDQKLTELALERAHDDLELRVEQRTAELAKSNELLKNEMKERKQGEDKIRASLKEKDVLLKEIHHRVRNNLQVISSLLQLARTRTDNKEASDLLLESYSRIHTMGLIHSQLYQNDRFDKIDMHKHLQEVVTNLSQLYGNDRFVTPVIGTANIYLSLTQAIPCAIAINELISNVFKHAYPKGEKGTVEVFMEQTPDGKFRVTVKDHGIGIPKGIDIFETESLGLKLTRELVLHQLNGKLLITRNNGTKVLIEFPVLEEDR